MNDLENLLSSFCGADQLAPEFDYSFYRRVQNDLRAFDDRELLRHYENHGRSEGRLATPAAHRVGFIAQISQYADILEIGPGPNPVFTGAKVAYFDTGDRTSLADRALREGADPAGCPDITFVSPHGDLAIVQRSFDVLFSSHCIEHQPDIVYHLLCASALLRPDGRYYIIIPDMRFCFDASLSVSGYDEIIEAHQKRRKIHTWENVRDHLAYTTHNNAAEHWAGRSDDPNILSRQERLRRAEDLFQSSEGSYIDVHAWKFTPNVFRECITRLNETLIKLDVERIYDTPYGRHEFCCVLRKKT